MSGRNRNNHRDMANLAHEKHNGVLVPADALERLRAENMAKMQPYLDELGKRLSIQNENENMLLAAAVQSGGLPTTLEDGQKLYAAASQLAKLITDARLTQLYTEIRDTARRLGVKQAPPAVVHSARLAGVSLFEEDGPTPETH